MMSLFFSEYLSEPLFILRRLMVEIAFLSPGQNIWQKVKEIKQNWTGTTSIQIERAETS